MMNFIQASRILAANKDGAPWPLRLCASGNVTPLLLYVRAMAAERGRAAQVETLDFGTLGQALFSPAPTGQREVLLLMPWDLVPECDWRSGIPASAASVDALLDGAQQVVARLAQRNSALLYVPAPIPPLYADPRAGAALEAGLTALAAGLHAVLLEPSCFSLGGYLASGVPIAGSAASVVAQAVIDALLPPEEGRYKVLATDLDNVMWAGLAAEDGADGVACSPEGVGFRHFLYQGLLARLKASGVILAAVSRNDLDVARAPIVQGKTLLAESDFGAVLASYDAKSSHIRQLAADLNVGIDAIVFVDDNPIELAEVSGALPDVTCVQFPAHDDQLQPFLAQLAGLFARRSVTDDDRQRTDLYRRRLQGVRSMPAQAGADLTDFLSKLEMRLTLFERSGGGRERAVQLLNKTNQFNLNGRRFTDQEVDQLLADGGKLYTARLDDRTGSHGEILACLLDPQQRIVALVMSCRVFQRQAEFAFICWLLGRTRPDLQLDYVATERNAPLRGFLDDAAFAVGADGATLDGERFLASHSAKLALFTVTESLDD
jgi:FkbH-like protein